MALLHFPRIVTDGLALCLDGANPRSYGQYDKYENLHQYSQQFNVTSIWSKGTVNIPSNTEIAPDGTNTAALIQFIQLYSNLSNNDYTLVPGTQYTYSIWCKVASGTRVYSVYSEDGYSYGSYTATTTWTRYSGTFTAVTAHKLFIIQDRSSSGFVDTYIWGAQLEKGSTLSPYFVTTTPSKTRGSAWRSGANLVDVSGNNNHGTTQPSTDLTSGVTFSTDGGGSLVFNGIDEYVTSTTNSVLNFPDTTFTVSAWIKTTQSPVDPGAYFISKDLRPTGNGWGLGISVPGVNNATAYGLLAYTKGSSGQISLYKSSIKAINDGIWHNVVAIITTDTSVAANNIGTLYIDGVLDNGNVQAAIVPYIAPTLYSLELGRRASGNYFSGNISQATIYNRALSATEILQNYNALKGRFGL